MKTFVKFALAIVIISAAVTSCKKSKKQAPVGALGPNYPYVLNTIITPSILDTLEKNGLIVHDGLTPPSVNGIYLLSPAYCLFDNSGDDRAGDIFSDELLKFSDQNSNEFSISLAYTQGQGAEIGVDNQATYISGTGNSFTIFAQARDTLTGVADVQLRIETGVITSGGIENLQEGLYLVSKGSDPSNVLIPVGTTRIFEDEDGFSETQTTFSITPGKTQALRPNSIKSFLSSASR